MTSFDTVAQFESLIAEYFGAKYGVATDSCTHAIELSLRYDNTTSVFCPRRTYLSIPMTFCKLGINWSWSSEKWKDFYYIGNTRIIDAAVLWRQDSYISGSLMCLSFQFKKHLSIGRGGMILTDDSDAYTILKMMSYDGRDPDLPWAEQNIQSIGYHYYMTPESAQMGIDKFHKVKNAPPKKWTDSDYPDLSRMKVFSNES